MTPTEMFLAGRLDSIRAELAHRCRDLEDHMARLAKRLEDEGIPNDAVCLNSLGEVQAQGAAIDAECGGFAAYTNALRTLETDLAAESVPQSP